MDLMMFDDENITWVQAKTAEFEVFFTDKVSSYPKLRMLEPWTFTTFEKLILTI